jgi:hypothetical protein
MVPLRLNKATFTMVHNDMSSRDNLFAAYNNVHPLEGALVAGYHGFMLDLWFATEAWGGTLPTLSRGTGTR